MALDSAVVVQIWGTIAVVAYFALNFFLDHHIAAVGVSAEVDLNVFY